MRPLLLLLPLVACTKPPPRPPLVDPVGAPTVGATTQPLAAGTPAPAGTIPGALPAELLIGMQDANDPGATWIRDAATKGARFQVRYRYLVKGWEDNWAPGTAKDGRFARRFLDETPTGVIPAFSWYQMLGESGSEGNEYATLRNTVAMRSYFTAFRTLMQVCKASGRPVVLVHLEPDAYAYLQQGSGGNTGSYAAVAATGLPELAGLPDTVAGWGQAFGRLRTAVGASQVLLGPHFSTWASGVDLMRGSGLTADIATHVGRTAAFLSALGTYDLVWVEWLDRDAAARNIWWDASDTAALTSLSFRRDLAIFEALNRATSRRLMLWQVPWGTSWSTIRSHHAEYVFGSNGAAHRERMGSVGVVGVLFGAGATGQTTHLNGWGPDGGLYLRGQVAAFQRSTPGTCVQPPPPPPVCTGGSDGGLALPRGGP
jgi:hypothetical protein